MANRKGAVYKEWMTCRPTRRSFALTVFLWMVAVTPSLGGGGPENVFLVFNKSSADSTAIAEHYARLRRVPRGNLFGVDWRGSRSAVPVEEFREELLKPILKEIDARKLSTQIDYVVYSADFPWRIDLKGDLKGVKLTKSTAPYASLTGATYLYLFTQAKSPAILGLRTNWYTPSGNGNLLQCKTVSTAPSQGFLGVRRWRPDETEAGDSETEVRYLLSTMLGVTHGRGNTVEEIRSYLNRAAQADSIAPRGTFYFLRNGTPRSSPRHGCYESVVQSLRALGAEAEVIKGGRPKNVTDVLGVMFGTKTYDLTKSGVKLMPGAIGDNLTSYGGIMSPDAYQTPLSEMLRHGAAGACGTVFEPTNVQAKFPLPSLMLHYRRGCSLAESFYQSVASPYQLLIVGDPLCQPWAVKPIVTLPNFEEGFVAKEPFVLRPVVRTKSGHRVRVWDLFIDGRRVARAPAGVAIRFDPTLLKPGRHEIRVVAIDASPIQEQGRWISNFATLPPGGDADANAAKPQPAGSEE